MVRADGCTVWGSCQCPLSQQHGRACRPPDPVSTPCRSFKDWLHSHTMEVALKARCGCASSAAGLRELLRTRREGEHSGAHQEHSAATARTTALRPGGEVTRRFLAPNPVVLQVRAGSQGV